MVLVPHARRQDQLRIMSQTRQTLLVSLCIFFAMSNTAPCSASSNGKSRTDSKQASPAPRFHGPVKQYYWAPFCAQIPEIDGIDLLEEPRHPKYDCLPSVQDSSATGIFSAAIQEPARVRLSARPEQGESPRTPDKGRGHARFSLEPVWTKRSLPETIQAPCPGSSTLPARSEDACQGNGSLIHFETWQIQPLTNPAKSGK